MIGIDLTSISRFEKSRHLSKFAKKFNVDNSSPIEIAKTWACIEAIIKAEDRTFDPTLIRIKFVSGHRPVVEDPLHVLSSSYSLSITYCDNMVAAVAVRN